MYSYFGTEGAHVEIKISLGWAMCGALIMFQFGSVRPSFALTRGQRKKGKVTKRFEALEGGGEVGG